MFTALSIALGGALGAVARFYMSSWVYNHLGRDFPWGTLAVNVLGSLLIGFLTVILVERFAQEPQLRFMLITGFLGAFTTFSTFSIETLQLIDEHAWLAALMNSLLSVVFGVMAVAVGILVARLWITPSG